MVVVDGSGEELRGVERGWRGKERGWVNKSKGRRRDNVVRGVESITSF